MGQEAVAFATIFRASGKSSRDSQAITPTACPNRTNTLLKGRRGEARGAGGGLTKYKELKTKYFFYEELEKTRKE